MKVRLLDDPPTDAGGVLYVRVDDADGALILEAERLGLSPAQFVRRELARARWLREAMSRAGHVLVEDQHGQLREVRYPERAR